jgi:hypothetical protein
VRGVPGQYESEFVPTLAGNYQFHLFGQIGDLDVDEVFTSADGDFDRVKDAGEAQYPEPLPPIVEVAQQAKTGADAAGQVPMALGLGAAGSVLGLAGIAIGLAGRRKAG